MAEFEVRLYREIAGVDCERTIRLPFVPFPGLILLIGKDANGDEVFDEIVGEVDWSCEDRVFGAWLKPSRAEENWTDERAAVELEWYLQSGWKRM